MGYRILFTEEALGDLESLLDYIRADNPEAADRFGDAILNHIDLLKTFPRIGVPVHGRQDIRKLLHTPIRVYYRILDDPGLIEILHFWHAARS